MGYKFVKAVVGALAVLIPSLVCAGGLLVVAPHPDDDLLIASGIVAAAKARGEQVKVLFVTNGDFEGISKGYLRQGEAVNAQIEYLGTNENDLIFLGYPDGDLAQIYTNYPGANDSFVTSNGQSATYGNRGLGRVDYHTYRFGSPARYNRTNMIADVQSVISTYLPDHIVTMSEFDRHADHSTSYQIVRAALINASNANSNYRPTLNKTIVWDGVIDDSAVWPEALNPTTYHVAPAHLGATSLQWSSRASLDVPLAMQTPVLANNPKYLAIQRHNSQGGASGILGRFIHLDEFVWPETISGASAPKVDAGTNLIVAAGSSVQLNGSGSVDPGGATLTYQWRQIGGTAVELSSAAVSRPTFTAPTGLTADTVLSFELVVSNGTRASLPDRMTVTVQAGTAGATRNVASEASVTASSQNGADGQLAAKVIDGVSDGYPGDYTREWATLGQRAGAWIELRWNAPVTISRVVLFDRPNLADFVTAGTLTFSDGSTVPVSALNNNGTAQEVVFMPRTVTSVRFTVVSASSSTQNIGLSELQVFGGGGSTTQNQSPFANASSDQTVASGVVVQLDGTASSDPEGASLNYRWQQIAGNTVTLVGATTARPTFAVPAALAQNTTYRFQLIVNDGAQDSQPSQVAVTALAANQSGANVAPLAAVTASSQTVTDAQLAIKAVDGVIDGYPNDDSREWATLGERAGAWIELQWSTPVSISRVVLFDRPNADDQILAGRLTFSDGTSATLPALSNDGSATEVNFGVRTITSLRMTVDTVKSSTENSGLAEIQVFSANTTVSNQAPISDAGAAQTVAQNAQIQLDGSASRDPEGSSLTYSWSQVSGPSVSLSSTSVARPAFVAPTGLTQNTVLSFQLIVNDGQINSAPSVVNITVASNVPNINQAPQATVSASSENAADGQLAAKATDGVISGWPGDYTREWATRGERTGAWIELRWGGAKVIDRVVIYDRPNSDDQVTAGTLTFSDGSTVVVPTLPNNGTALTVTFSPRAVTNVRFNITGVSASSLNIGLSEIEVYGSNAP